MNYQEIEGDLIELAKNGSFDVIAHGCNCFCTMGAGIAVPMKKNFMCGTFPMEDPSRRGDISKLGQIEYKYSWTHNLWVVNAYTQYRYGRNHKDGDEVPVDYEAIRSCMKKINTQFAGKHVGLPKIGAGLAGGDWEKIKTIIQEELTSVYATIIIYKK